VALEYRWADGQYNRLRALAGDLVARNVAVIVTTGGTASAIAAKSASATISIVFNVTDDPVKVGLVANLNKPGGNATGVTNLAIELEAKKIGGMNVGKMPLRIVFMGTPEFAVPTLVELVGRGHEIVAVYTRAPKPAGRRGHDLVPSPVQRAAEGFGLPVLTPSTLRTSEAQEIARGHEAEIAVVVAYGLILPRPILDAFPLGAFNLHASLLPRWRGAAPIHRAIMAGDSETGVMVMKMDEGLDTGPIAMAERVPIAPDATTGDLHDRLCHCGADLIARALAALERGSLVLAPQPQTGITYANKIDNSETHIVWSRPWQDVHNHVRGLSPYPGAWFEVQRQEKRGPGVRVKVLRSTKGEGSGLPGTVIDNELTVACQNGAVRILELQPAGRQAMKASEFLRGTSLPPGTRLG